MEELNMRYVFVSILLISSFAKANEIYRWQDAKGRIHYSESAPLEGNYQQLGVEDLPPVHSAVPPDFPKSVPVTNKQPIPAQRVKKSRRVKSNEQSLKQCRRYREQLEGIAARLRAGYREPTGNRLRAKRRQIEQRLREDC
jgi:hypothetical protein